MIKILFTCLGNICRSPLAEAVFNHKIKQKGLESMIFSDSSGTAGYHIGEAPDPRSVQTAEKHGVPIKHYGQQFTQNLAQDFDYLIAMDASNRHNMIAELGYEPATLFQMRDFDSEGKGLDVPDPYYGGNDGFENVYDIIERSTENLIAYIKKKHQV